MSSTPLELPGLSESDALATLTPADADRFRIVVTPDADADNPLDWGGVLLVGVARHTGGGRFSDGTPDDTADPLELAHALDRFSDALVPPAGHWVDRDASAEAVIRWARVFHGVTVARWAVSLDQSTYVDALVYLEADAERAGDPADQARTLAGFVSTLTQWGRGDVVTVSLERDAAEDRWEGSDWQPVGDLGSLGGCYLEPAGRDGTGYTAAACVADHWGVPRAFADAVPVVESFDY